MSVRFLLTVVTLVAIIACSSGDIQVDQYDINVGIQDGAESFTIRLDTDLSGLPDDHPFTITAKRMYRANGMDQQHAVFSHMSVPLRELEAGKQFTAWTDREAGGQSKLSDESLVYEIARRAKLNQDQGRPWTSIEVLDQFCVSVYPDIERSVSFSGEAAPEVASVMVDGERKGRISQQHIRECVPFGGHHRLR